MNVALQRAMTTEQFLAWEERQPLRDEFDGFQPVAMTGGTDAHEAIGGALRALLRDRLRGKPCRVRGPTLKIEVMGRIRYPDAFVYCTPAPPGETVIKDPVVVFEVLSSGTSRTDRIEKLRECQATGSVRRYVILEQDGIAATVFERHGPDWDARALTTGESCECRKSRSSPRCPKIYADVALQDPIEDAAATAG